MKTILKLVMVSFVLSILAATAFAGTTPDVMHVSCTEPTPDKQNGLRRPKGDSDVWTFAIALEGGAHFVKGPYWSYPGKGGGDPDWGMWTGGADGDSSLGWSAPHKTGSFSVRVSGQISCGGGGGGDGKPIDFEAGWDGKVCPDVQKIQYNDPSNGYVDATGTLHILKGTKVTFKAIPDQPDAEFCDGEPDQYRELNRTIVTPSAYMIKEPDSGVEHTSGIAGLAFHAWVYLTPKDVSFKQLQVREGTGTSIVTADINGANTQGAGYFAAHGLEGIDHEAGAWQPVISNSIVTGSRVGLVDTVGLNGLPAPYASANTIDSFAWPIQWWYKNGDIEHELAVFTHYVTIDDVGTVTISKGGAGPVTKTVGADTTTIHPPGHIEE